MFRKKNRITVLAVLIVACVFGVSSSARAAVVLEVGADTPVVQVQKDRKVIVRALVRPDKPVARTRAPLAVALVLDRSGSMGWDGKIENAKLGALEALKALDERDIATVVVYDTEASLLVRPTSAGERNTFSRAIARIRPGGSTALYDGVQTGAQQLRTFIREGYVPRIVLLSDGLANVGPSSTRELANLGRTLAGQEVTITTIGLGPDYNEDLMTALASESGGNAYFAKNPDSLPDIFARDMEDAVTLTARKVRVTLTCGDRVRPIRVLGRTGTNAEDSLETSIDNLYGAEKYALFELEIPALDRESPLEAGTVRLEYVDAETGSTVSQEAPLTLTFTKDADEVEKNRQPEIVAQAALARNAEIREEVVRLADEGRADEASRLLKERTGDLKKVAPVAGSAAPKLEAEARSFESLADSLKNSGGMSNTERKSTLNDAYIQKNQQAAPDRKH